MLVLKVTEEETQELTPPKPPEGYENNRHSDHVTYSVKSERAPEQKRLHVYDSNTKMGDEPLFKNQPCYSLLRPHYDHYTITCRPLQESVVTLEEAQEFLSLLEAYQIVPSGMSIWQDRDKGIFLRIPENCGNPHQVYAALTAYRWIDRHPPLVWTYLYLIKQGVGLTPWRILPYVVSQYVRNQNHSFLNSHSGECVYVEQESLAINPLIALGLRGYFNQEDPAFKKAFEDPQNYVNSSISKWVSTITPKGKNNKLRFGVENPVHLLHPIWDRLLAIENPTLERVEPLLASICTEEETK